MRPREIDRKCIAYEILKKHLPFLQEQIIYHKTRIVQIMADPKAGNLKTHDRVRQNLSDLDQHIREELALCKRYKARKRKPSLPDIGNRHG